MALWKCLRRKEDLPDPVHMLATNAVTSFTNETRDQNLYYYSN